MTENYMLETERLKIYPLTPEQLRGWIYDVGTLEKTLGISYEADEATGEFAEILKGQLAVCESDRENYIWHTFWFIERKSDGVIVGSADFKSVPDDRGDVEIGYGLGESFFGRGYMTETVKALCGFAFGCDRVRRVIAETEVSNEKSHNVLRRCGFSEYYSGETLWWELKKK